jgi:uncharacterized phage protein gp47/JayE
MSFEKDFNTILQEMMTDYGNLSPAPDLTQGTLLWIKSACFASALWGLYKYQEFIKRQIFPHTCSSEFLDLHASDYGITRMQDESDTDLLARLLTRIQHAPSGGNRYDYEFWAKEISVTHQTLWAARTSYALGDIVKPTVANDRLYMCTYAGSSDASEPTWPKTDDVNTTVTDGTAIWKEWASDTYTERAKTCQVYSNPRGTNSIDILITSNTPASSLITWANELPTNALLAAIQAYIDDVRPVGAWDFTVQGPARKVVAVTYRVPTGTAQSVKDQITLDTTALLESLTIGETLYLSQLVVIAVNNGIVISPSLTLPAADVTCYPTSNPAHYERIWPGTISFVEV